MHIVVKLYKKSNQFTTLDYCKYIAYLLEREYKYSLDEPVVFIFDMDEASYSNIVNIHIIF